MPLQDILDDLTPTKHITANGISYKIAGFILKEPKPSPNKVGGQQYFDEQEQRWVLKPNSNTTDECGDVDGRVFYRTERSSAA